MGRGVSIAPCKTLPVGNGDWTVRHQDLARRQGTPLRAFYSFGLPDRLDGS